MEGEERVELRPRRWPIYATAALLLAVGGIIVWAVFARERAKQRGPAVAKILEILDTGYRTCVLGTPVADAELAPKLLEARFTGTLTASRVRACGELAQQKLESLDSLRKDDHALDAFWGAPYREDRGDFGLCAQLELVHSTAKNLGVPVANAPCGTKLEPLAAVVGHLPVMFSGFRIGDEVLLDEPNEDVYHMTRTLRRSRNGTDWQTSDPIRTNDELHISSEGVWAYEVGAKDIHLARLDGTTWVAGPHPPGDVVHWRRTDAGWTFLLDDEHGARVWRTDPSLQKVVGETRIANVWSERANQLGVITADATAGVLEPRLAKGEVSIEAHIVHPDGTQDAPRVTKLASKTTQLVTAKCTSPGSTWIAIGDTAMAQTRDAGATFTVQTGDVLVPELVTCTDSWLMGVAGTHFVICERGNCTVGKVPHAEGTTIHTHLTKHGDSARLLVTDDDNAVLYRRDPGGAVTFAHAWTFSLSDIPMVVRADDTWFFISG